MDKPGQYFRIQRGVIQWKEIFCEKKYGLNINGTTLEEIKKEKGNMWLWWVCINRIEEQGGDVGVKVKKVTFKKYIYLCISIHYTWVEFVCCGNCFYHL